MADEKDKADNTSWPERRERAAKVWSGLGQGLAKLLTTDLSELGNPFRKASPKSTEEFAQEFAKGIDGYILEKERSAKLTFVSGTLKMAWGGDKFLMSTELYYQDSEGKWQKEESSTERPAEELTEESRKTLEEQKEITYPIEHP
ncbi:MAG: hypothetical protein SPL25_09120 [Succinivibrionaceae bacterium]|nr:hypothetical protein [Succinivibrionaceae bacterium]